MIQTFGLTKDYGGLRALDSLDLEVKEGEIFGYIDPNGAGKTTTLKILATLLTPSAGRAEVCGLEVGRHSQPEHPDEMVDGAGRPGAAEHHRMLVGGPDTSTDDLAGLFPETGRLQAGAGRFGVSVGVQRQYCFADEVFDEGERASRGGVVGVGDPARTEGAVHYLVLADD